MWTRHRTRFGWVSEQLLSKTLESTLFILSMSCSPFILTNCVIFFFFLAHHRSSVFESLRNGTRCFGTMCTGNQLSAHGSGRQHQSELFQFDWRCSGFGVLSILGSSTAAGSGRARLWTSSVLWKHCRRSRGGVSNVALDGATVSGVHHSPQQHDHHATSVSVRRIVDLVSAHSDRRPLCVSQLRSAGCIAFSGENRCQSAVRQRNLLQHRSSVCTRKLSKHASICRHCFASHSATGAAGTSTLCLSTVGRRSTRCRSSVTLETAAGGRLGSHSVSGPSKRPAARSSRTAVRQWRLFHQIQSTRRVQFDISARCWQSFYLRRHHQWRTRRLSGIDFEMQAKSNRIELN